MRGLASQIWLLASSRLPTAAGAEAGAVAGAADGTGSGSDSGSGYGIGAGSLCLA